MSASYEIKLSRTLLIHNVSKVKLKKRHIWFWGADGDLEYVAPVQRLAWVRRLPDSTNEKGDVMEVREPNRDAVMTTIVGVQKIVVDDPEIANISSVYAFDSDDDDLPAGYVNNATYYSITPVGRGPELVP